ncbi:hypothetical protein Syun_006247 [Stephania yunnanensis]|uniref:Disease resistance protein RGA3 n=1 Tax=Stephania yunnanensis TaxID=152371 RepID=A0AAP0KWB9_9MAGN
MSISSFMHVLQCIILIFLTYIFLFALHSVRSISVFEMAEEIVVGGVGVIVKRIVALGLDEVGLLLGVNDEVRNLQGMLNNIQAVLEDAEKKQVKDKTLRVWLKDLKEVAYDAEDVLDKIAYEELKQTIINNKVSNWFSTSNPLVLRFKIAHKIKDINKRLDVIDKRKNMFQGITAVEPHHQSDLSNFGQMINVRETSSFVDRSTVIAREVDKEKIVRMLIDHRQIIDNNITLSVIPIVGFGGLGKTTLAQLLYNEDVVKKHFDLRVWVCVSNNFDTTNLFAKILEQIIPNNTKRESSSKQVLQNDLENQLKEKKFLLVLDDVWNERKEKWDDFVLPLKSFGAKGSRIIVTSRSHIVASIVGAENMYQLQVLSDDSCWDLFERQAFMPGGAEKTSKLVEIGREIANKCKGVPLAAKVLGGMMHSKKEERDWLAMQNAEIWNVITDEENQIMEVLKLSYNNLHPTLKSCFSYCALFPKDFWISRELLIQLWMAQGLVGASSTLGESIMEDVGNSYFNILYSKCFFQEAEINAFGEITHCKMHDLVHDLAQSICESECQIMEKTNRNSEDISKCRHASSISPTTLESLHKAKKVRTIIGWESYSAVLDNGGTAEVTKISTFFDFKSLRVLDMSGFRGSKFSSSLGDKLRHLRFLDLSYTSIKSLPKWVTRLYNLQTLKLIKCDKLNKLPEDLKNLKKLRHLFIDDYSKWKKMAQAIGELHRLQTLPMFVACKEDGEHGISVLENLNNLRGMLDIFGLSLVKEASFAKRANLQEKSNLHELMLHWSRSLSYEGDDCDDLLVLEELRPHPNLKRLSIVDFRANQFPLWVSSGLALPNLVSMDISFCGRFEHIPALASCHFWRGWR